MKYYVILILCMAYFSSACGTDICGTEVKKGQVWRYPADDPFETVTTNYYVVLDVKDGWVKYRFDDNTLAFSEKESTFKIDSKLAANSVKEWKGAKIDDN